MHLRCAPQFLCSSSYGGVQHIHGAAAFSNVLVIGISNATQSLQQQGKVHLPLVLQARQLRLVCIRIGCVVCVAVECELTTRSRRLARDARVEQRTNARAEQRVDVGV